MVSLPHSVTVTVEPRPPAAPQITPELREAIREAMRRRVRASRGRLDAVAHNFPERMRAAGLGELAGNLEDAVEDVIGHAADPSRPGALGRMLAEVEALLDSAEDA